ncbi:MAG: uroporphyrinogen-III C-methyltransferase [Alphaproteobacteria bacterium]|nr:uroporphyrinogen-III C-methyltransferase [Alphaproteobacteria bacterium]
MSKSANAPLVKLVGAGPGAADLLTVRACRAIEWASVLLVDDLVSPDIVALASPQARVIAVGKRGGCRQTPQAFIERLMVRCARAGERVVRLKGGDPFIFGRGGEEVQTLREHGIEVEVINGITAGLAGVTSLGVPLTHREHAQGVVLLTGHSQPGSYGTDWGAVARAAAEMRWTLVIYMGVRELPAIEKELRQGLGDDVPVAVVQNATLPQQRHAVSVLSDLSALVAREGLGSPSVVVVGDVLKGLAHTRSGACENSGLIQKNQDYAWTPNASTL